MEKHMSELCKWLHERLDSLPVVSFPFAIEKLPRNGIYFFYENGEDWGHGGTKPRIVRIGTARDGNFRSRISEHFLLDERKMQFDTSRAAPHERSIFRKNIGLALLNREHDPYMKVWEKDLTSRQARDEWSSRRNINKEKHIEGEITQILRKTFSFRFLVMDSQAQRMGKTGLESPLIGSVAHCEECRPSDLWLGRYSPKPKISAGKLWLVQYLSSSPLSASDQSLVIDGISQTEAALA
jgi:hypothetical protein